jgi:hypothetical protein
MQLQDSSNEVIAFFRPTRQTRYQIGDVFGELHFVRTAGMGTVVNSPSSTDIQRKFLMSLLLQTHPPIMDMVTLSAMLYRFCATWNV